MKTSTPPAALRGQLFACQQVMGRHLAAVAAIEGGRSAKTCPLSNRKAGALARQIADLKTAIA